MISRQNFQRLLKVTVFLFLIVRLYADPILSLTFDDPNGTALTVPDAEIASGAGGKAQLRLEKSDWTEGSTQKIFQVIADSAMGTKSFLRLVDDKQQVPGTRGFIITPSGIDTSLAALARIENGKFVINGAFDMFFRYNEEIPSQQALVPNLVSIGGIGLRLIVESDAETIVANLVDEKDETIFDTDLDGATDATRVKTSFVKTAPIDPEVVYHLAVSFETTEDGVVTLKVFLKAGHGAINSKEDEDLVSQASFSVINEDSEKTLQNGSFSIGANSRSSPAKVILDLAGFRIFKPTPAIFPDISGKQ